MRPNRDLLGSRVARRVFLSFAAATCVPLAIFSILAAWQVGTSVEQRALEQLDGLSRNIGQQLLDRLLIATDALNYARVTGSFDRLTGIADGTIIDTDGEDHPLVARSDQANIAVAQGDKALLFADRPDIFIAKRSDSRTLVGRVDPEYLWHTADLLPFGIDLCVFDNRPSSPLFCTADLSVEGMAELRRALAERSSGNLTLSSNGERHLAVHWELFLPSRFEASPWSIVVSQPTAIAYGAKAAFNRAVLPTALVSSILVILLSISLIRRTLTPLRRLASGAQEIGRQRFAVRMPEDTPDEFGELGAAMNDMADRLGRQFDVLTTFAEIDRLILSSPSIEHVLDSVLGRASAMIPGSHVSVLVIETNDPSRGRLFTAEHDGRSSLHRIEISAACESWLQNIEDDFVVDAALASRLLGGWSLGESSGSVVAIPLAPGGKLRGALLARTADEPEARDMETLRELGRRLAVAVSAADRERDLFDRAHFDQLTRLPNRQLCMDRLAQALGHARRDGHRLGVLFLDLDSFKNINDSLGHSMGDQLLVEVARRLTRVVRDSDTVARLGGDEYVILLPRIYGALEAEAIAHKALEAIKAPYSLDGRECHVTVSVGAAIFPEDGSSVEELLRRADTAMYSAKESGRARCTIFSEELDQRVQERLLMQSDLRSALAKGEFELAYQPEVDLASGKPVCAEALLRWVHPQREPVPPGVFVPILEESGLIDEVGRWVIERALEDLRGWRERGLPLARVSVNLASRQLLDRDLVRFVRNQLAARRLDGSNLEFELTEHSLISDFNSCNRVFSELRSRGVRISIDDFGTGYSSLGYLRVLEFDVLKIDRTFVAGISDGKALAIVEAVSKLAHALGKSIVAEGIETAQQRRLAEELGCDLGQGFLFARPLPAAELEAWVRESHETGAAAQPRAARRRA